MACPEEANAPGLDKPMACRNALDSVRLLCTNQDVLQRRVVSCFCGELINRDKDWYTMVSDGTLVCMTCTRCSRCRVSAITTSRKLVSVDGLIMCYSCLREFGYMVYAPLPIRLDNKLEASTTSKTSVVNANAGGQLASANNEDAEDEDDYEDSMRKRVEEEHFARMGYNAQTGEGNEEEEGKNEEVGEREQRRQHPLSKYNPKKDGRKPFRIRRYPKPERIPDLRDNPCETPSPYLGLKGTMEQQKCPSCGTQALGTETITMPAMSRVYHKACLTCSSCNCNLSSWQRLVYGKNYLSCTCEPPLLFCMQPDCREAMRRENDEKHCVLDCARPGGRV